MPEPQFPTLVTRAQNGAPLPDAAVDANWTNIRAYCLTLAALISGALNPDGTLVGGSVGSQALQAAAVTLASLNPSLLYSIIPVDSDIGTQNAYAVTARGGATGSNLVAASAVYDQNGNYVLNGLTLNYGFYWTQGTNDVSVVANSGTTLTTSGAFTATQTSITLTGTPGDPVTASVVQSAPVNQYKSGQLFFVWTTRSNTGSSTLNVNNLGSVPILLNGQPLQQGDIQGSSVFIVCYMNGAFNLVSGGATTAGSSSTNSLNFTVNGTLVFDSGQLGIPTTTLALNHGLGGSPSSVTVFLVKTAADATTVAIGRSVPIGEFISSGNSAFVVEYDSSVVQIDPTAGNITLGGTVITTGSWALQIKATRTTNVTNNVLPALSYWFARPEGAFSYGGYLIVTNTGRQTGSCYFTAVNLTNNEVVQLQLPAQGTPFSNNFGMFTRLSGAVQAIFTSTAGVYLVSATNPLQNIVPQASFYGANQLFTLTISAGVAYTITKGSNDTSYSLDGVTFTNLGSTPAQISSSNTSTTLTLLGNAGGLVTASAVTASTTWQAQRISTLSGYHNLKPVWITENSGSVSNVYVVSSSYGAGDPVSALRMLQLPIAGGSVTEVGSGSTRLDLTNANIANIAQFNQWHPASSQSAVIFFSYNPFTKRIYVMTDEVGLMHVFQITGNYGTGGATNDITAFWAATNDATKYGNLSYVKALGVAGIGELWGTSERSHISVEIDQATGLEKAIVFTREGNSDHAGSVTRVPWIE